MVEISCVMIFMCMSVVCLLSTLCQSEQLTKEKQKLVYIRQNEPVYIHKIDEGQSSKRSTLNTSKHMLPKESRRLKHYKHGSKKKATKKRMRHFSHKIQDGRRSYVAGKEEMEDGLLGKAWLKKSQDERPVKRHHFEEEQQSDEHYNLHERPILGRCDINKQCKADQYCEGSFCFKCRKEDEHCYANGQCCKGAECQYGYCAKGVSAGMPGTYCDKTADCKGSDTCCILEMSIDHHNAICKPMLEQHETCGPINLFHQMTEYRAHNEMFCGPCKQGLACKSIGIFGHHSVCLPEGGD